MDDDLFDVPVDRRGSGSLKWDLFEERDILPFWVADMDFRSPPEVIAALQSRVDHGVFGYARPKPSLTEAVIDYGRIRHGVEIDPDWLVWLPGLVPGLSVACKASGDSRNGDEVMTATPVYPPFLSAPGDAGLVAQRIPLTRDPDTGKATFDLAAMEKAANAHTRLFILCNPHNPTGRVYSRLELQRLIAFCEKHDLVLCSDEVHCDLIYDEETTPHVSLLEFGAEVRARTIVLMSASKTFNIAGLGCAFAIIPDAALRRRFRRAAGGWMPLPSALALEATEAALRFGEPWRRRLVRYLDGNRRCLSYDFAARFPGLVLYEPLEATYLAWIDARPLALKNAATFFRKHGVGLSDGAPFGQPGFVRFNFGCARSFLVEGLRRMETAVKSIS